MQRKRNGIAARASLASRRLDTPEFKAGKNTGAHDFHLPDVAKETDATLIAIVTKGKKKMPKFEEKLKAKEIKELVEYVRGFSKKS